MNADFFTKFAIGNRSDCSSASAPGLFDTSELSC